MRKMRKSYEVVVKGTYKVLFRTLDLNKAFEYADTVSGIEVEVQEVWR